MNSSSFRIMFTKRWLGFFTLFFVVWYPVSLLIVSAYEVTGQPLLFIAGNVFTPLWTLLVSFLYFRKAPDDWASRFITAFGWIILLFLFSAILVKPIYGYDWTSIINLNVLNANWINMIAIVIGGFAAHKSGTNTDSIKPMP